MVKKKNPHTVRRAATAVLSLCLLLSQAAVALGSDREVTTTLTLNASGDTVTVSAVQDTALKSRLEYPQSEEIIRLEQDQTLTEPVIITAGTADKPVILDLNGFKLQWEAVVIVEGAFYIRDSSKPQTGKISVPAVVAYPEGSQPVIHSLFQLTDGAALKLENLNIITDSPLISLPSSGMGTFTMADCTVGTAAESQVPATVIFRIEDNLIPIGAAGE